MEVSNKCSETIMLYCKRKRLTRCGCSACLTKHPNSSRLTNVLNPLLNSSVASWMTGFAPCHLTFFAFGNNSVINSSWLLKITSTTRSPILFCDIDRRRIELIHARASGVEKNSTKQSIVLPVERSIIMWTGGPRSLVMILAWGPRKLRSASLVKSYGICSIKASKQAVR